MRQPACGSISSHQRSGRAGAATLRSTPGDPVSATLSASNLYLTANSTLGRPLAGGEANMDIALVAPNSLYLDRRNQVDLRFGKIVRVGRARSVVSLDLFNAMNSNTVITANAAFDSWLAPTSILNGRLAKVSVQLQF